MRFLLFGALILAYCRSGQAQSARYGKPVIWYTVYDPWAMFIEADGPVFAVYESGQVIYWKNQKYSTVRLDKSELAEMFTQLSLSDTFFLRSQHISVSGATDEPSYVLRINLDTLKSFSVYGNLRDMGALSRVPAVLKTVYEFVTNFDDDRAVNWLPKKIEVLLSDYDYSPEKPIPWPANWPNLKSPETRTWEGGATLYLDQRHLNQLKSLIKARTEKQAFLINERKFYAGYRLPLPGIDSIMTSRR